MSAFVGEEFHRWPADWHQTGDVAGRLVELGAPDLTPLTCVAYDPDADSDVTFDAFVGRGQLVLVTATDWTAVKVLAHLAAGGKLNDLDPCGGWSLREPLPHERERPFAAQGTYDRPSAR